MSATPDDVPKGCTGHIEDGRLSHNGDTCPVHETEPDQTGAERMSAAGLSPAELGRFTDAYLDCALWSTTDEEDRPLDEHHDWRDAPPEVLAEMVADCRKFADENWGMFSLLVEV